MSLLDELRATGEKLAEVALPAAQDVIPVLGALAAHLEASLPELAHVELAKLEAKLAPPEGAEATAVATAGPAPEGPDLAAENAQLRAELATAKGSSEPAVISEPAPPA